METNSTARLDVKSIATSTAAGILPITLFDPESVLNSYVLTVLIENVVSEGPPGG